MDKHALTLRRNILISIIISAFIFSHSKIAFSYMSQWLSSSNGINNADIKAVAFDANNPLIGYVGTDGAVYKTDDGGKFWKPVLSIRGQNTRVNNIAVDPHDSNIVYTAAENGLYRNNIGSDWQKIFDGRNVLQSNCLTIAINEKIFVGTQEGLFMSTDKGANWHRQSGKLSNLEVASIALSGDSVYAATSEGVFKSKDKGNSFEKIYSSFGSEDDSDYDSNGEEYTPLLSKIHQILIDPRDSKKIYLATDDGVFTSDDEGDAWSRLPVAGLTQSKINAINFSDNRLFAATEKGVFEFIGLRWNEIYQGLVNSRINFISDDTAGNLWAATDNGVYKLSLKAAEPGPDKNIMITKMIIDNFKDEPSIQQIQKQAIKYAEVHPHKINSWRKQAMLAALMPTLTLDFDRTIISSMSSASGGYYRAEIGPQDWAVNLKWDISELIWNPDQTSIDSRSKLMVELRDEILDEVTRIYFERRRLQIENMITEPASMQEKIDRELRLAELTASIDALTGRYLSRMIQENDE